MTDIAAQRTTSYRHSRLSACGLRAHRLHRDISSGVRPSLLKTVIPFTTSVFSPSGSPAALESNRERENRAFQPRCIMEKGISATGRLKSSSWLMTGLIVMFATSPIEQGQTQAGDGIGPFRTQTIQLEAGWNAVYLEIEPRKGEPSALFAGTPIEIAAAYMRPVTAME